MAGSDPNFPTADFNDGIRQAMSMGAPVDPAMRPTFRWSPQYTFTGPVDASGQPYDPSAAPATTTDPVDVQVPVAVEFAGQGEGEGTEVGTFDPTRATLTLLGDDYAKVVGADTVLLNGKEYDIIEGPFYTALFDASVVQLHALARSAG